MGSTLPSDRVRSSASGMVLLPSTSLSMNVLRLVPLLFVAPALAAQTGTGLKIAHGGTSTTQKYLEAKYDKSLVPQTGLTVECWLTYDESGVPTTSYAWPTVLRMNSTASKESYWLRVQAGNTGSRVLAFALRTSSGFHQVQQGFSAGGLKTWTHVAVTWDRGVLSLYLNGKIQLTNSFVGSTITDNGGTLRIGIGEVTSAIEAWNGEIDEVRIWPVARTQAEIQETMNLSLKSVPGRVSVWNLDSSAKDSSFTNHCTAVNSPTFASNTLKLTPANFGSAAFGGPTNGCGGVVPAAGAVGLPTLGSTNYRLTCLDAAHGTGAVGYVWLGAARLQSSVLLDGAALWVNPAAGGLLVPVMGDAAGLLSVKAPIPSVGKGSSAHIQFFFSQSGCNVPIFSSEGLTVTIQ